MYLQYYPSLFGSSSTQPKPSLVMQFLSIFRLNVNSPENNAGINSFEDHHFWSRKESHIDPLGR